MIKHEERKELLKKIDEMQGYLNDIRGYVINYDYNTSNISLCALLQMDAGELKDMIYEAKVCKTK